MIRSLRVALFARAPESGRVKTRLTPALGADGAARLYRRMLRHAAVTAARAAPGAVTLWCAPDAGHPYLRQLSRRLGLRPAIQRGADLGERMATALTDELQRCDAVVLIGSDIPALAVETLQAGARALAEGADVVLGPAEDGGYFLIGMRQPVPALFDAMPWSTGGVLSETRSRLRRYGLRWTELAPLWDVDCPDALARLAALPAFASLARPAVP